MLRVLSAPSTTEAIERSCAYACRRALDLERLLGHEVAECTVVHWERCAAEIVEYADDIDSIMDIDSRSMYPPAREVPGLSRAHAEKEFSLATSSRWLEHFGAFNVPTSVAGIISLVHAPQLIPGQSWRMGAGGSSNIMRHSDSGDDLSTPQKVDAPLDLSAD